MTSELNKKQFLQNSFYLMLASLAEKAFFFIVNIIIARYLSKEHFGEYSTALSFATFFSLFANLGIGFSSVRLISREGDLRNRHYAASQVIKVLVSLLAFLLMCIALYFTDYNENTIYLTLVLGVVRIGNEYLIYLFSLLESFSKFAIISVFTTLFAFSFMVSTICVVLLNGDYFGIVFVRLVVVLVFVILALLSTRQLFRFGWVRISELLLFIRETIPFGVSFLLSTTTINLAPLILPLYHGTVYTGIYNNAFIFFTSLLFIPAALGKVIMPYLYRYDFNKERSLFTQFYFSYAKLLSVLSFYCLIILICFSGDIIRIIFGHKYDESIPVLNIMAFAIPYSFNIAPSIIPTMNKQKINSFIDSAVCVVSIPLSLVLIKYYTIDGAALSVVLICIMAYSLSNLYTVFRGINYSNILVFRMKLFILSLLIFFSYKYLKEHINFIFIFIILSIVYLLIVYFLFLSKKERLSLSFK